MANDAGHRWQKANEGVVNMGLVNIKLLNALDDAGIEYILDGNEVNTPHGQVWDMCDPHTKKERYEFDDGLVVFDAVRVVEILESIG